ncbi:MAG: nucleotide-binding protein [Desulfobacteraceae bacterium]|nr:nucleotide-binding protein [Desulfobacteraceae bacterium]
MQKKIKKDIKNLVKLQEAEQEIIRLNTVLAGFELEKKKISKELSEFEDVFNKDKDEYQAIDSTCKEYENEIQLVLDRIRKSNEKLRMVKTNKEYQALKRELDDNTKRKLSLEDELFDHTEKKEEIEKKLEEREKDFVQLTEKINSEKEDIDKNSKDDLGSLEEYKAKKKKLGVNLDSKIFEQFKIIAKMHDGEAVAQGKNEVCMGCFMNIPPQLFIEIQRGDKLIKCPQCSRFLFFNEESK